MELETVKKLIYGHWDAVIEGRKSGYSAMSYEDGLRDAMEMICGDWEDDDVLSTLEVKEAD